MRIAIAGLVLTAISTIVAILTMPEVRDILGLDTPGSHRDSTGVDEFSPPDPAFDPLLATLGEMTEAPVMLPARLPDEMDTPVIDGFGVRPFHRTTAKVNFSGNWM